MKISIPHSSPYLGQLEKENVERVLNSGYLASGEENRLFALDLAKRFRRKFAVLTSSGTAALHLLLLSLGCKKGYKVYLPSYVCTALLNAIHYTGAEPVVVDVPQHGFLADPKLPFLSSSQKEFVIYPQLFGYVQSLPKDFNNKIIEDGAMSLGPNALSQGVASITSFYATKMITTAQGGAILTDREDLYLELKDLMDHDNRESYRIRYNSGMSDLSAALGRAQLSRLDEMLEKRDRALCLYDKHLKQTAPDILAFPKGLGSLGEKPSLFRYWVRVSNVDHCVQHLKERGIEAKRPVYRPLHAYLGLSSTHYPHTTSAWESFLSLPFYPSLTENQIKKVVTALSEVAEAI